MYHYDPNTALDELTEDAILPNPVARSARAPAMPVRRLAGLYERRSEEFSGLAACIWTPSGP